MELVKKIHITADPTIDSGQREYSLRTDMKITTVQGDVDQKIVDIPSGFPGNAMSAEEHIDRFWDAATYKGKRLPEEKIEKIIDTVRHLEAAKDIRSLIPLLSR
jgi:2-methylcitrate dehydratase PrpD